MARTIETRGLGKRYRLRMDDAGYDMFRDAVVRALRRTRNTKELWALRDVTLDVDAGEAVGIIGSNGAGKTTLLKILAGITEPTVGGARTRGRVGALLDVGTGFHLELTGRENVFLSGALFGMPRRDVERRFGDIVEFAGVERFLDTPMKRYSTGMQLRLAFAVAAHVEAPIVVVDEILAVADDEFRARCLGKVGEMTQESRTVVFVSHDLGAVAGVCPRVVWLDSGEIRRDGPADEVIAAYRGSGRGQALHAEFTEETGAPVAVAAVSVAGSDGRPLSEVTRGDPFELRIAFDVRVPYPGLDIALSVVNASGQRVLSDARSDRIPDGTLGIQKGRYVAGVVVPPLLVAGRYSIQVRLGGERETLFERDVLALTVRPRDDDRQEWTARPRLVQPPLDWTVSREPWAEER